MIITIYTLTYSGVLAVIVWGCAYYVKRKRQREQNQRITEMANEAEIHALSELYTVDLLQIEKEIVSHVLRLIVVKESPTWYNGKALEQIMKENFRKYSAQNNPGYESASVKNLLKCLANINVRPSLMIDVEALKGEPVPFILYEQRVVELNNELILRSDENPSGQDVILDANDEQRASWIGREITAKDLLIFGIAKSVNSTDRTNNSKIKIYAYAIFTGES